MRVNISRVQYREVPPLCMLGSVPCSAHNMYYFEEWLPYGDLVKGSQQIILPKRHFWICFLWHYYWYECMHGRLVCDISQRFLAQKNMVLWGIPEKSIKNVAQWCWLHVHRSLQSKVMAKNRFLEITPFPHSTFYIYLLQGPKIQVHISQKCTVHT